MPWGNLSGVWWGRQDVRPVLTLHGWMDNAGTFDRLIPLLPDHVGYLAIDLPGHGRSGHFAPGMYYNLIDYLRTIETVRLKMKWDVVSLLAHSMGSKLSFYYSSLKPKNVDMFLGIDVMKPLVKATNRIIDDNVKQIDKMIVNDARQAENKEPPSYTLDELSDRVVKGSHGSVPKELAHHLLERAVSPSKVHDGKFYFHRDDRLKMMNYTLSFHELAQDMAKRIEAPHFFVKANQAPYYEDVKYFDEVLETLKQTNPNFWFRRAEGQHHIHLTDPTKISADMSEFIRKFRPE